MDIGTIKLWLGERWGWVVTAATCVLFFFDMGFLLSISIIFPSLQQEFNSTNSETAWVGTIPFGLSIFSPIITFALDIFGPRPVVVAGLTLSGCGLIASSFVQSLWPLFITYSLAFGLGAGMMMFGTFSLILRYFPLNNSTRAVVMPMASANLGMFTLGPLTYVLKTRYGWRNMLRIMGAVILAVTVPVSAITLSEPDTAGSLAEEADERINDGTYESKHKYTRKNKFSKLNNHEHRVQDNYKKCAVSDWTEGTDSYRNDLKDERDEDECLMPDTWEKRSGNDPRKDVVGHRDRCTEQSTGDEWRNRTSIDKSKMEESDGGATDVYSIKDNARSLPYRILVALTYPDLLFLAIAVLGYGLVNSFVIIQLGSYMLSIGYSEENGAQALVVMGVSLLVGKTVLVLFADRAPFPKLCLFLIASVFGIISLVLMLLMPSLPVLLTATGVLGVAVMGTADSLPYSICNHVFGVERGAETVAVVGFFHGAGFILASLLAESVDSTGTYDLSLYACIGTYALCAVLCVMVPVWQRCFVKGRPVMDVWFGWRRESSSSGVNDDELKSPSQVTTKYSIVNRVTTV